MKTNLFTNIFKTIFGSIKKGVPTEKPNNSHYVIGVDPYKPKKETFRCTICKRFLSPHGPGVVAQIFKDGDMEFTHEKCLK